MVLTSHPAEATRPSRHLLGLGDLVTYQGGMPPKWLSVPVLTLLLVGWFIKKPALGPLNFCFGEPGPAWSVVTKMNTAYESFTFKYV